MSVVSKDSILESVKTMIGETPSDEGLELMENISDTYADLESRVNDTEDWKTKYEENDRQWRQKYTERFSSGSAPEDDTDPEPDDEPPTPKTFEELFEVKE